MFLDLLYLEFWIHSFIHSSRLFRIFIVLGILLVREHLNVHVCANTNIAIIKA